MTLIVVRREGDCLIAIGDTKLSPEPNQPWSVDSQANKLVCIGTNWIIAYAGNAFAADLALKSINATDFRFATLREKLLSANQNSILNRSVVDFLIISVASLTTHKIADGECKRMQGPASWLGSKAAFEKYQELYHLTPGQPHKLLEGPLSGSDGFDLSQEVIDSERDALHGRMNRSLKALIRDNNTPEVGGVPITVVIRHGVARFWPSISRVLAVPHGGLPPYGGRNHFFGDASFGDFQYETITGLPSETNVVAIYWRLIEKALVFKRWDGSLPYAKVLDNIPATDAAEALQARLGCDMWQIRVQIQGNVALINSDPPKQVA